MLRAQIRIMPDTQIIARDYASNHPGLADGSRIVTVSFDGLEIDLGLADDEAGRVAAIGNLVAVLERLYLASMERLAESIRAGMTAPETAPGELAEMYGR